MAERRNKHSDQYSKNAYLNTEDRVSFQGPSWGVRENVIFGWPKMHDLGPAMPERYVESCVQCVVRNRPVSAGAWGQLADQHHFARFREVVRLNPVEVHSTPNRISVSVLAMPPDPV